MKCFWYPLTDRLFVVRYSLLIFFACAFFSGFSQDALWGISPNGGATGNGVIFKYVNGSVQTIHSFTSPYPGSNPQSQKLLKGTDGKLYGTTGAGGTFNKGVLYRYSPATKVYEVLYQFGEPGPGSAFNPGGNLMQASNGLIYGGAMGGAVGSGILFEFDPVNKIYSVVHDFDYVTGATLGMNLAEGDNQKLYGTATGGGANGKGVIFEFDLVSKVYTKKHDFLFETGCTPWGGLMRAADGTFYGMTWEGGWSWYGGIYQYDATSNTVTIKRYFGSNPDGTSAAGAKPWSVLHEHPNGKMYAVTRGGGLLGRGTIIEYDPLLNKVTQRGEFSIPAWGGIEGTAVGDIMLAANGKFYGVSRTVDGGGGGHIYEFDPGANTLRTKGEYLPGSEATLVEESAGILYGSSSEVEWGDGHMFKFDVATNARTVEFAFSGSDGSKPYGTLTQAYNGKLYGLTNRGGSLADGGVIFELDPVTGSVTRKVELNRWMAEGSRPIGGFVLHPNGKLYAATPDGQGYGAIIEFDPSTGTITHQKYFDEAGVYGSAGSRPYGPLALAPNGKMYGLCSQGGSSYVGTLFEYDPMSHAIIKKIDFGGAFGTAPKGGLTLSPDGKLYGFTSGVNHEHLGVLFQYDFEKNSLIVKATFDWSTGVKPEGAMVVASNGSLYGHASAGGGFVFQYNPSDGALSSAGTFGYIPDASMPIGGTPFESSSGYLIGFTKFGGAYGLGCIYQLDIASRDITVLHSFDGHTGLNPEHVSITRLKSTQTIQVSTSSITKTYGNGPFALTATTSSGLPISYASANTSVAKVVNGVIHIVGAGSTVISVLQNGNGTHLPAQLKTVSLTVNKATLTVTANNKAKVYGSPMPGLDVTYSGFIGLDSKASLATAPSAQTNATTASSTGTYAINVSGGDDENYTFVYTPGVLTIAKATLTARVNAVSRVYGEQDPQFTVSYSGFLGADNLQQIDTKPVAKSAARQFSNTGKYVVMLEGGEDNNYAFNLIDGEITITKAPLIVTANNATRPYGQADPTFEATYVGFRGADDISVLTQGPEFKTLASKYALPGKYAINLGGALDDNYEFTYESGTLTIVKAQVQVAARNASRFYGKPNPAVELTFTGTFLPEDQTRLEQLIVTSVQANESSNVGEYAIHLSAAIDEKYALTLTNGILSVTKAPQTISFDAVKVEGSPIELNATASSGLPVTFSSSDEDNVKVEGNLLMILGSGKVTITASQSGNQNYLAAESVTQTITIPVVTGLRDSEIAFSVSPNPTAGAISIHSDSPITQCILLDISGKVIYQTNTTFINLSEYPSGTYTLLCKTEGGWHSARLVKFDQ